MPSSTNERLIALPEVHRITNFCKSQLYNWIAAGTFPPPVKIGRASRWVESEVQDWIAARVAATRSPKVKSAHPNATA